MSKGTPEVAVLGGGPLARALVYMGLRFGLRVRLWTRRASQGEALVGALADAGESGGVEANLQAVQRKATLAEACGGVPLIFVAVPISGLRELAVGLGDVVQGDQVVVHGIRGVAPGFRLPHEVLREETCLRQIAALGGPLQAPDIARGTALVALLASRYDGPFRTLAPIVKGSFLKLHKSSDIVGTEVAGAMSNVSALAVGMAHQLRLGGMAEGVLLTHGLVEATRLGKHFGADPSTFAGLAGVGELIPRLLKRVSRHRDVGARVVDGVPLDEALKQVGREVEGVATAAEALAVADAAGLELPLVRAVHGVLHGALDAETALRDVLSRDLDL